MEGYITLWAWRFSVARGWRWVEERACFKENGALWLEVFRQDEPGVRFVLSEKKPAIIWQ